MPIFGLLKFKGTTTASSRIAALSAKEAGKVKVTISGTTIVGEDPGAVIIDSHNFYMGDTATVQTSSVRVADANKDVDIVIDNKYLIEKLSGVKEINLDDLKYVSLLHFETIGSNADEIKINGNISNFEKSTNLSFISIRSTATVGDVSSFRNMTEIKTLQLSSCSKITGDLSTVSNLRKLELFKVNGSQVSGNIHSLGVCTRLSELNLHGCNISGSVEDFVSAQRANGRTSGNIYFGWTLGTNVTFNGAVVSGAVNKRIIWTPTSIEIVNA